MIKNEAFHTYENCFRSHVIILSYCIKIANHAESDVEDEDSNMFLGHHAPYFHLYPFSHQNIHFSQKKMRFLTPSHKHIVFTLFIEKNLLKMGIQGNNLDIFYETLKPKFKENFFSKY